MTGSGGKGSSLHFQETKELPHEYGQVKIRPARDQVSVYNNIRIYVFGTALHEVRGYDVERGHFPPRCKAISCNQQNTVTHRCNRFLRLEKMPDDGFKFRIHPHILRGSSAREQQAVVMVRPNILKGIIDHEEPVPGLLRDRVPSRFEVVNDGVEGLFLCGGRNGHLCPGLLQSPVGIKQFKGFDRITGENEYFFHDSTNAPLDNPGINRLLPVNPFPTMTIYLLQPTQYTMDLPYVAGIINAFALVFTVIGAAMVIYGGSRAVIELVLFGLHRRTTSKSIIKREFTGFIIFGLEFFIAGDVLTTVLNPTIEDLTLLGAVVVIRVVLAYFLEKESKEYDIDS
jgi:uncharacterized membrane protein